MSSPNIVIFFVCGYSLIGVTLGNLAKLGHILLGFDWDSIKFQLDLGRDNPHFFQYELFIFKKKDIN